jgi:hypothetical protein
VAVSSVQRASKNERMLWPALPTGESSSLNVSQLSKITLTSAQNSSRPLYLRKRTSTRRGQPNFAQRAHKGKKKRQAFIRSEMQVLVKLLLSLLLVRESIKARKMNETRDLMQFFFRQLLSEASLQGLKRVHFILLPNVQLQKWLHYGAVGSVFPNTQLFNCTFNFFLK